MHRFNFLIKSNFLSLNLFILFFHFVKLISSNLERIIIKLLIFLICMFQFIIFCFQCLILFSIENIWISSRHSIHFLLHIYILSRAWPHRCYLLFLMSPKRTILVNFCLWIFSYGNKFVIGLRHGSCVGTCSTLLLIEAFH